MSAPLDSLGMYAATRALPAQMVAAADVARAADIGSVREIDNVVILGMGGSGVAGDVCAAIASPTCRVPLTTVAGYVPPAFVGPRTLVIAVSVSGNTEEVVEATSAALAAGAPVVGVTAGGTLGGLLSEASAPVVTVDASIPMPRAAVGAVAIPTLVVLGRSGLIDGVDTMIDQAVAQVQRRVKTLDDSGDAEQLARQIGRTLPIIYGGGAIGGVAARRWKNQFNENAKVPAFANELPELTHNEICGWGQHGDLTRQIFSIVMLRHDHEHAQVARRFGIVDELVDEVVAGIHTVTAEGDGALAQLFDLMYYGDLVTLHLASREGLDPGPVPVLIDIKERLSRTV